jgi:two-component system response regulator HupR/HoxA
MHVGNLLAKPVTDNSTILLVSNQLDDWADTVSQLTNDHEYRVLKANGTSDAIAIGREAHVDLVLCEENLDGTPGADLLRQFRIFDPYVIRILVKETIAPGNIHDVIKQAAIYQYVRKPLDREQIGLVVKRALEARELARRHRLLSRELKFHEDSPLLSEQGPRRADVQWRQFEKLVFASESMAELCELAKQAAPTELPILIEGETGTGKELVARAVHYNSKRAHSPLMVQNCGGMPDELLQSELFGHVRGAFTGAAGNRLGLFRAADGGTVFLDEISDVSHSFQVSLLRFLQNGEVKPLGADTVSTCNVRIIAASNKSLNDLVKQGKFRQDLYFRLKGFQLKVPPLRERPIDIPVLAEFFARNCRHTMGRRVLGIAADVLEHLSYYSFPGNVRELENEIRRMVAMADEGGYLTTKHLSAEIAASKRPRRNGAETGFSLAGSTLKEKVESLEEELVKTSLKRHRWNQSEAARELGLSRVGLANKIKRYGIDPAA